MRFRKPDYISLFADIEIPEHDDFVGGPAVLPAAEEQQMWPDGSGRVAVAVQGRRPDEVPLLPRHHLRVQNQEIVDILLRDKVLLAS